MLFTSRGLRGPHSIQHSQSLWSSSSEKLPLKETSSSGCVDQMVSKSSTRLKDTSWNISVLYPALNKTDNRLQLWGKIEMNELLQQVTDSSRATRSSLVPNEQQIVCRGNINPHYTRVSYICWRLENTALRIFTSTGKCGSTAELLPENIHPGFILV